MHTQNSLECNSKAYWWKILGAYSIMRNITVVSHCKRTNRLEREAEDKQNINNSTKHGRCLKKQTFARHWYKPGDFLLHLLHNNCQPLIFTFSSFTFSNKQQMKETRKCKNPTQTFYGHTHNTFSFKLLKATISFLSEKFRKCSSMHYTYPKSIVSRQQLAKERLSLIDNRISGKDKHSTSPVYFQIENRK